ncbi:hypothetical protein ACFCT7_00150 [Fulvivirgaceae bacterium LMO-SS25]
MDYRTQLRRLSEIVNKHIAVFTSIDNTFKTTERSFNIPNSTQLIHTEWYDTTFGRIFNLKSPDQRTKERTYFHYKSFDLAYKFINENFVTASALSNFVGVTDDIKEYEHFFNTTKIPCDKSFIDNKKKEYYIFCLTENNKTKRFWREYVSEHKGLCLEFEFIDKKQHSDLFELRSICYDNGNDFKFYSEMQDEIFPVFDRYLLTQGLAKFGAFYKRKTLFEWETETRLLFDFGLHQTNLNNMNFSNYSHNSRKYLKVPLDNDLFSLKVKSIAIGKNLSIDQKQMIKDLANRKGILWTEEK